MSKQKEDRVAVTVRFPRELMERARALENGGGSFNDLVVKALEREVRMRHAREVGKRIDELRERTRREFGLLSDSTPVIRQLREGIGRRD